MYTRSDLRARAQPRTMGREIDWQVPVWTFWGLGKRMNEKQAMRLDYLGSN